MDGRARTACRLVPDPAGGAAPRPSSGCFWPGRASAACPVPWRRRASPPAPGGPSPCPACGSCCKIRCTAPPTATPGTILPPWGPTSASPGGLRRPPGPAGLPEAGLLRRPRPRNPGGPLDHRPGAAPRPGVRRDVGGPFRSCSPRTGPRWCTTGGPCCPACCSAPGAGRSCFPRPGRAALTTTSAGPSCAGERRPAPAPTCPARRPIRRRWTPSPPSFPAWPPAGGAGPGGTARRVPHPPPAGRLGRGGPGLHPLPPLSVCPSPVAHSRPSLQSSPCSLWAHPAAPAADCWPPCSLTGVILLGVFPHLRGIPPPVRHPSPRRALLLHPGAAPYRRPRIGQVVVRSVLDRTLFVLGRAAAVAAPAGLLIWLCANVQVGGDSILNWCTGFLDPFARLLGLDGVILMAFLLGFPANEDRDSHHHHGLPLHREPAGVRQPGRPAAAPGGPWLDLADGGVHHALFP